MPTLKQDQAWDFDTGQLPLDFANTAEWHASQEPTERLTSYADLVGWSWKAGLLTEAEALRLLELAEGQPQETHAAYDKAIELREAIYQVFSAAAAGARVPRAALAVINAALAEDFNRVRVEPSPGGFSWSWSDREPGLDRMLLPILRLTAELLTSDDLKRVGECADDRGCGYLFFDQSRNRSRRWCSIESCGNRAKARRHYARRKTGSDLES